jgi:hypothetical protein
MEQIGEIYFGILKRCWQCNKDRYAFADLEEMSEQLDEPFCFWAQEEIDRRLKSWEIAKQTMAGKDLWTMAKTASHPYADWALSEILNRQNNKHDYG